MTHRVVSEVMPVVEAAPVAVAGRQEAGTADDSWLLLRSRPCRLVSVDQPEGRPPDSWLLASPTCCRLVACPHEAGRFPALTLEDVIGPTPS